MIPSTIRKSPRVSLVAIPTDKSRFERETESLEEMVQRMSTMSALAPNRKDAVVFIIGSGDGGGTVGEAQHVKSMPMPGTQYSILCFLFIVSFYFNFNFYTIFELNVLLCKNILKL